MNRQDIGFVQSSINYQFKNLQLLEQAFTRKSYSEEHTGFAESWRIMTGKTKNSKEQQ